MTPDAIGTLVAKVQDLPDAVARNTALDLVQAVMDLHAEALGRALEIVAEANGGSEVMEALGADAVVSGILLLHDLHPLGLEARVRRALDRPEFRARGASAELLAVDGENVRVKIEGGHALREAVETALSEAAPDAVIEIEGAAHSASFVPLAALMAS